MLDAIKSAVQMEDWSEAYKLCILFASKIRKNMDRKEGIQSSIDLIKEHDPGDECRYCRLVVCECVQRVIDND